MDLEGEKCAWTLAHREVGSHSVSVELSSGEMSNLTAAGWKKIRDVALEVVQAKLRRDISVLSLYQRGTLAELKLIGKDLYSDIRRRGVILSSGEVNPAVEAHRKNAHEQLYSLSVFTELNRSEASQPVDLVAEMAAHAEPAIIEAEELKAFASELSAQAAVIPTCKNLNAVLF